MVLQFKNVFIAVIIVQLDAGFLGRETGLCCFLFTNECRTGGGFSDSNTSQPRFLQ